MATERTRTWTSPIKAMGGVRYKGGSVIQQVQPTENWHMSDVIQDYGGVHSLYAYKVKSDGGYVVRPNPSGWDINAPTPLYCALPAKLSGPAAGTYVNRILAQTGLETPRVSLPVFLVELRDIPKMLRHIGDLLHKIRRPSGLRPDQEAAAAVLAYQFGWAPLMQDLSRMMKFGDVVKRRQRDIMGAHSARGLRRKVMLDSDTASGAGSSYVWSTYGFLLRCPYNDSKSYKTWGSVVWKSKGGQNLGYHPSWNEGFKSAFGLNRSHIPRNLWKILPWTWAIDWFADISNILDASNNMVHYTPSRVCVMRQSTTKRIYPDFYKSGELVFHEFTTECTWKERWPVSATPHFQLRLPFLDNFKLSILGAMSIQRLGRR